MKMNIPTFFVPQGRRALNLFFFPIINMNLTVFLVCLGWTGAAECRGAGGEAGAGAAQWAGRRWPPAQPAQGGRWGGGGRRHTLHVTGGHRQGRKGCRGQHQEEGQG